MFSTGLGRETATVATEDRFVEDGTDARFVVPPSVATPSKKAASHRRFSVEVQPVVRSAPAAIASRAQKTSRLNFFHVCSFLNAISPLVVHFLCPKPYMLTLCAPIWLMTITRCSI